MARLWEAGCSAAAVMKKQAQPSTHVGQEVTDTGVKPHSKIGDSVPVRSPSHQEGAMAVEERN